GLPQRAAALGGRLSQGLAALRERFPQIVDIRGRGLLWGMEWDGPAGGIVRRAMDKGLLLLTAGPNVVRFAPPLTIDEADVDEALSIVAACLEEEVAAAG